MLAETVSSMAVSLAPVETQETEATVTKLAFASNSRNANNIRNASNSRMPARAEKLSKVGNPKTAEELSKQGSQLQQQQSLEHYSLQQQ